MTLASQKLFHTAELPADIRVDFLAIYADLTKEEEGSVAVRSSTAAVLAAGLPPGSDGFKHFVSIYRTAFPDVQFTIEDQIDMEINHYVAIPSLVHLLILCRSGYCYSFDRLTYHSPIILHFGLAV